MTLDEAIKHAEEVADLCEDSASKYDMTDSLESHMACKDGECAEEHRQIAEWLKELKQLREQTEKRTEERTNAFPCDCISRQEDRKCASCKHSNNGECAYTETCHECMWENQYEQQVEPERKSGHWEWDQRAGEYVCSECGCNPIYERTTPDADEIDKYRYCRWCGAPMEVDG